MQNVAASVVRQWARENINLIPAEGHACLGERARGRLHPTVQAAYKKAHKGKKGYEPKVAEHRTITVPVKRLDKLGRATTVQTTVATPYARDLLGHPEGRRGRFNLNDLSLALEAVALAE